MGAIELAAAIQAYDPKQSADNRADELKLHRDIVMLTGIGTMNPDFDRTFLCSLDAAMTLLPPGWVIASLDWWPMTRRAGVTLREVRDQTWGVGFDETTGDARSQAATPALALTATALLALAEQVQQ